MDLNYDIDTWICPLTTMTITKLLQEIVETARLHPSSTTDFKIVASRAIERVQQLDLPRTLITKMKMRIKPMLDEIDKWYQSNGYCICPILTAYGTVDWVKSTRALLNKTDMSIRQRYKKACEHGLDDLIFTYGKQLSPNDTLKYENDQSTWHDFLENRMDEEVYLEDLPGSLAHFWYHVYKGRFCEQICLKHLNADNCAAGFEVALFHRSYSAMRFFLGKASQTAVQRAVHKVLHRAAFAKDNPPSVFAIIFRIDPRECHQSYFSRHLLEALLDWPYQHLFLKAAESLAANLTARNHVIVLHHIVKKVSQDYEDYNYKGLFVGFWKMVNFMEPKNQDVHLFNLLLTVFEMRDKAINSMVLDNIAEHHKQVHLFKFNREYLCILITNSTRHTANHIIAKVTKEKDEQMYLTLKRFLKEYVSLPQDIPLVLINSGFVPNVGAKMFRMPLEQFMEITWTKETSMHQGLNVDLRPPLPPFGG